METVKIIFRFLLLKGDWNHIRKDECSRYIPRWNLHVSIVRDWETKGKMIPWYALYGVDMYAVIHWRQGIEVTKQKLREDLNYARVF